MGNITQQDLLLALKRCESEPIHQLGLIQPHGALVVFELAPGRRVLQVSTNIECFFGKSPDEAVAGSLQDLLGEDQTLEIVGMLERKAGEFCPSRLLYSVVDEEIHELQINVHRQGEVGILELEPINHAYQLRDVQDLLEPLMKALWSLDARLDINAYCSMVADLVRSLLAFERVMIYHFDDNWDGEVLAESRAEGAASYLGNRFPAGDIPPQARALYTRNLLRVVNDVNAKPLALIPALNPLSGQPVDLSLAVLRAFSPVHVEYLKNMGVSASLSISILLDGKLWGLIACHHAAPTFVPHPVREVLQFVGKIISMKLAALDAQSQLRMGNHLGQTLNALIRDIYAQDDFAETLQQHALAILDLVRASGAVLRINGQQVCLGQVPEPARIEELFGWLGQQAPAESLVTEHLVSLYPAGAEYAELASGLLATPIAPGMKNCMLWFRPERLRTINWAGYPEKRVEPDALGDLRISPRKSFAVWHETWRQRSDEWTALQIDSAVVLSSALIDAVDHKKAKQTAAH